MIPLLGNRAFLALIAIGGVLALATTGAITLSAGSIPVPAETKETYKGWEGAVHLGGGLDDRGEKYITAGDPGGSSQAITAQGTVTQVSLLAAQKLEEYQYRVYVNDVEQVQLRSQEYPEINAVVKFKSPIPLTSYTFSFTGQVTGALKVELWAKIGTFGTEWHRVGYDGAALVSGAGTVQLKAGSSNLIKEGSTLVLDVRTGEGLWTLQVFNGRGQATCGSNAGGFEATSGATASGSGCRSGLQWSGQRFGTVGFVVPIGAFDSSGSNSWHVLLKNERIDHSTQAFFVIDKTDLAPEVPKVTASPVVPKVGEKLTLLMESRPNAVTKSPIARYEVRAWYGNLPVEPAQDSPNWIARAVSVPASSASSTTSSATYQFTVSSPDVIQYRIAAYDQAGRPSGSVLGSLDCEAMQKALPDANCDGEGTVHPEGSGRHVGPQYPPDRTDSGLIVLMGLLALVGGAVVWFFLPFPPLLKVGLVAAIVILAGAWILPKVGGAA